MKNNRYNYKIYGLCFSFNIELPLLNLYTNGEDINYYVDVIYEKIRHNNSNIDIFYQNLIYIINLSLDAKVSIMNEKKYIEYRTIDFNTFFSTFFNIPCSLLMAINNNFLMHASSIILNNSIICFLAEKGVGKSSLTSLLATERDLDFFADDSIRITEDVLGYKPHNLMKLYEDVINEFSLNNVTEEKNVQNKTYLLYDNLKDGLNINKFIYINRHNSINITLKKIENSHIIRTKFLGNIIGINYYSFLLFKEITKKIDFYVKRIDFYQLKIPNSLNELKINLKLLISLLKNY